MSTIKLKQLKERKIIIDKVKEQILEYNEYPFLYSVCSFGFYENYGIKPEGDINKINIDNIPDFDILCAGFPCQPFSIAGNQKGFDDKTRGNLFYKLLEIIDKKQPNTLILENVKNLCAHDKGNTFKVIEETLTNLGYHLKYKVLNTMEYGNIPQNRERIYIVGFKNKQFSDNFSFPEPKPLTKSFKDFLEEVVDPKYYYEGKPLYQRIKDDITSEDDVYQWRRQYVRRNKKKVCPTLTANMGTGGHNVPIIKDSKGIRRLTPLECVRLQGFPFDYKLPVLNSDGPLYSQAGNYVSVPVIESIANRMKDAILSV